VRLQGTQRDTTGKRNRMDYSNASGKKITKQREKEKMAAMKERGSISNWKVAARGEERKPEMDKAPVESKRRQKEKERARQKKNIRDSKKQLTRGGDMRERGDAVGASRTQTGGAEGAPPAGKR